MKNMEWFFSAGDGPFYFAETIRKLGWFPVIWRADEGLGTNHAFRFWYDYSLQLVIKIRFFRRFQLVGSNIQIFFSGRKLVIFAKNT